MQIKFDESRCEQVRLQVGLSEEEFENATGYNIANKTHDFIDVIEKICSTFDVETEYFFVKNNV